MHFKDILSFFFPPRCVGCGSEGILLCRTCEKEIAKTPRQVTSTTWALLPYHHPVGERLIHAMKFEGKVELARVAGKTLASALPKILGEDLGGIIVIPIPTSKDERAKRGYDHVLLIAKSLAGHSGTECFPALVKIRNTERQVTMKTREKRLQNLKCAFQFDARYDCTGKTVILVDDVTTTGATFREATRALEDGGAERIICLALAH